MGSIPSKIPRVGPAGESLTYADYFLDLRRTRPGEAIIREGDAWLKFGWPSRLLVAHELDEVTEVLNSLTGWAVGFVAYEAGPAFDEALKTHPSATPLAWFALYDRPPDRYRELLPLGDAPVTLQEPTLGPEAYAAKFEAIKQSLGRGDLYQVNLTFQQPFEVPDAAALFADRCGVNPPPFATYINGGDFQVASFSPELFFERFGEYITCRPMKGTQPIYADPSALKDDPKNRAENVMIVDMVRNDLGRIARPGTVETPKLLEVERHRGLQQMTTTVTAETRASVSEIFNALFPPASVTGAPKVSACRRICELEDQARGIYCGAIGYIAPGRERFNVAIRTAWIEKDKGVFGIGSGVVWDSEVESEYQECLAKRDVLLNSGTKWGLIESMPAAALHNKEILDAHMKRLVRSAYSLCSKVDEANIRAALPKEAPAGSKIRIEVDIKGAFKIEVGQSAIKSKRIRAVLATEPMNLPDWNVRHKTTSREIYNRHLEAHPEADEVLLYNCEGFLTEFCRGNVVLQIDGRLLTASPTGCLRGIGVKLAVHHGTMTYWPLALTDLEKAEAIYFINSTVGLIPVDLAK